MTAHYQPYYCEENIWHLAASQRDGDAQSTVAFISNPSRAVAMWLQRAAPRPGLPLVWDYHVILLAHQGSWQVFDLDTVLPCPTSAADYLAGSFARIAELPADFAPRFRLVDAGEYVRSLASDRSHMRDRHGRYRKPPPAWPCIGDSGKAPNLHRFIDMEAPFLGRIVDLEQLAAELA